MMETELAVNFFMWILAALPIIVLLVLMVKFQVGAVKAAPVGLIIAIGVAVLFYKAPGSVIITELGKGLWNAFTVLVVIWPAIFIYEVTNQARAFQTFRKGMQKLSPNELLQILAIGWVFVSFLQGITGFGVPVAVGAPLLIGIGVRPLSAVTIALLGHAWANTFGTLAVAWNALAMQTSLVDTDFFYGTALWASAILWLFNFISGLTICWWYGKGAAIRKGLVAVIIISLIHGGGQLLLSQFNPTLAAFIPACLALGGTFLIGKIKTYRAEWRIEKSPVFNRHSKVSTTSEATTEMGLHQAFFPYYCLIFITLTILLISPIKQYLGSVALGFSFPESRTGYGIVNQASGLYSPLRPFIHAGTFLFLSGLFGYLYFRAKGMIVVGGLGKVCQRTVEKSLPSTIGIIALVVMSKIMGGTGQIIVLAKGTAQLTQGFYTVLSPAIGILGSFITSSNLASNILFGEFQKTTSFLLNFEPSTILAAQTAGGAIGNTISPGNVLLGTTTAGILGSEGTILKMILPITITVALFVGISLFIINSI